MRTVVKGVAPPCLGEAYKKGWSWDQFVANDQEGYRVCRQQADSEQKGICAYTELPLEYGSVTIHIDHFRKKAIYQRLRFEWSNLFVAVKDHRFGADFKDGIVDGKNEKAVYETILSPLTQDLQHYFHYATNGEVEPSFNLDDNDKKRAKETIDVFNLNEDELVSRRRTMMAQIKDCHDLEEDVIRLCFEGAGFLSVIDQEVGYLKENK